MDGLRATVTLILGLIALGTAIASWAKWARPRLQQRERDRIAQRDALIGRPPIYDSITRKEISPALPGIGQRMANTEGQMAVIAEAVADLVKSNQRHESHEAHLAVHDREIADLKQARVERVVTKAESIAAYQAMEAAALAKPDHIDEDHSDR